MIRFAVTISLVPEARGGPFVFWDDLRGSIASAADLGFDAVEIFPPGPDAIDIAAIRRMTSDRGLSVAAVGTGAGWVKHRLHLTLPESPARERARHFICRIIDAAGELGAPAIIGSMQGRSGDGVSHEAALGWLGEALVELGEHARQYGVPLIYEPLNRYETNLCNTVAAGVRLLESLGDANVVLLGDLFHMNIEEADMAGAIRAAAGRLGHVHFVDSNRLAAGCGHLDLGPIAAALRSIGYRGYISAEALPLPDSMTAAQRTITTYRSLFSTQG